MLLVTTKSGATYTIDYETNRWRKRDAPWQAIDECYCIYTDDFLKWNNREKHTHLPITVGKKLFISGPDYWWLSTEIVSIDMRFQGGTDATNVGA